jgi:hypothetical protein
MGTGDPLIVAAGEVKVSPARLMGELTIAPMCMVKVPSGRKSHQEPIPSFEGRAITHSPTGELGSLISLVSLVSEYERFVAAAIERSNIPKRRIPIDGLPAFIRDPLFEGLLTLTVRQ